jgi:hypothetical protein
MLSGLSAAKPCVVRIALAQIAEIRCLIIMAPDTYLAVLIYQALSFKFESCLSEKRTGNDNFRVVNIETD